MIFLLGAAVLAVPAATTLWLRLTVRGESSVVSILGPLHQNDDVAESIADSIAEGYGDGLGADRREEIRDVAADALRSESFASSWEDALRDTHGDVIAVMDGERTEDVSLVLGDLADEVNDEVGLSGRDRLPDDTEVKVIRSEYVDQVRDTSELIDKVALVLPLATLVLGALGLAVARNRLRAVSVLGVAVAVIAAVSALITKTVPGAVAAAAASDRVKGAVEPVTEAVASSLLSVLVALGVLGVVAAGVAFFVERRRRIHQPPPVAWPGA